MNPAPPDAFRYQPSPGQGRLLFGAEAELVIKPAIAPAGGDCDRGSRAWSTLALADSEARDALEPAAATAFHHYLPNCGRRARR